MDPIAATTAAAAQGHLIAQTRLSLLSSASGETSGLDPLCPDDSTAIVSTPTVYTVSDAQPDATTTTAATFDDASNGILILTPPLGQAFGIFPRLHTCRRLRRLCLDPIVHLYRLRNARLVLSPLLTSPSRPTLADLIARSIFLTNNSVISRRLARSLVSIRLSRRLALRPSAESLVQRAVLPRECVPGMSPMLVAPALVAKRKAIERERLKDSLRRWVASKWRGEVKEREEDVKRQDEAHGVGRVWKLRRFWERVNQGEMIAE
ncbi:hypothetical protein PT974_01824 [Cladobotryum mycophilum]|uniref:Uncharacterized protein n=1 Tax=Cladobotryum mycophilum TaxID=491253 RepID=A0ABR0SWM4_9HYPO